MTLVIAIKARDGVVMASDTRKTLDPQTPNERYETAKKIIRLDNNVMIGIAGRGDIASILVKQSESVMKLGKLSRAMDVANFLKDMTIRINDFPVVEWILTDPQRSLPLVYMQKSICLPSFYVSPSGSPFSYCCIGLAEEANRVLSASLSQDTDIIGAVVAAKTAIQITSERTPYVNGFDFKAIRYG